MWLQHPSTEQYRYYQRKCLSLRAVSAKTPANLLAVAACMGSRVCSFALADAYKSCFNGFIAGYVLLKDSYMMNTRILSLRLFSYILESVNPAGNNSDDDEHKQVWLYFSLFTST